ncbi:hypothetical protein [Chania multitudinisentens]|uniref:hypothetical protein n=1 Tax=Chania multitudinisentens TaxID=1639108 RepID=UPI0004B54E9A|nr:hypothetical protein [Chania multitudinisentens]
MSKYGLIGMLFVAICLGVLTFYYQSKYTITQQSLNNAQAVTKNALSAISLMHDISKVTHDEKQQLSNEGEEKVVYIKEAVKSDDCANRVVAVAATDSLRLLENRVRAGKPTETKP